MKQLLALVILFTSLPLFAAEQDDPLFQEKLVDLGRALFFDVSLSRDKTLGCASCHDPAQAFIDWRGSPAGLAASVGNDMKSLGDRNAPTLAYAAFSPEFHRNSEGEYVGGQFWDGREPDLEDPSPHPTEVEDGTTLRITLRTSTSPELVETEENSSVSNQNWPQNCMTA